MLSTHTQRKVHKTKLSWNNSVDTPFIFTILFHFNLFFYTLKNAAPDLPHGLYDPIMIPIHWCTRICKHFWKHCLLFFSTRWALFYLPLRNLQKIQSALDHWSMSKYTDTINVIYSFTEIFNLESEWKPLILLGCLTGQFEKREYI